MTNISPTATSRQGFHDRCRIQVRPTKAAITTKAGGACSSQTRPPISHSMMTVSASKKGRAWVLSKPKMYSAESPTGTLVSVSQLI